MKYASIVKAMLAYFGMTSSELISEWKQLGEKDKQEFAQMLHAEGYEFPINEQKGY